MRVREFQEPRGWAFVVGAMILKPLFLLTTKPRWVDGTKIPASGGCVVVMNHVSHVDPLTAAHFCYDHGRLPRYLAKSGLFKGRVLGYFMRAAGQIPVERASVSAVGAYDAAVAAVRAGECIVVYPEGTITRDPDLWPMKGKSGAARIALETGCPVIPVGQWGAQALLAPYARKPDLFPRKPIHIVVGDPVDLSDLAGRPRDAAVLDEATGRIMAAITGIVEGLRHEKAPLERFDPRKAGVSEIGNPHARRRKTNEEESG
ncbi:1-acyl-sn-glycerol-3-phosphate acyltransferase [Nocardioides dongxiaopingii]|uniref:lysophospholipid acyltransferase family protein n=1 Tax=Nocardioides TaxID=1839 RepID=UPI0010C76FFB|nr:MULTISPECIES: lysophospholipid acyltransferase family protein [Nocardioides]QCW51375.1 1-acyl-sn-glycerol-3-phosphate acyltransferase [Nocardioides sp. S-1144]